MAEPPYGFFFLLLFFLLLPTSQPAALDPSTFLPGITTTVPALPVVVQNPSNFSCHLDLSDELFGGVSEACSGPLDRSRCCPVLASWLFAAHARSALTLPVVDQPDDSDIAPMMPDDSQRCVDSLQSSLRARNIRLARPNSSCDAVLCFCGIRLHQLSSLRCPAAFNISSAAQQARNATPTAAARDLESNCRNASYAGCTRCLLSLQKLKGGESNHTSSSFEDRASQMFGRDCQLMGLTWLLERNKTAYIPTVSAVLRALLYSAHPPEQGDGRHHKGPRCSPDQENMPLAVNSLQFEKLGSSAAAWGRWPGLSTVVGTIVAAVVMGGWV